MVSSEGESTGVRQTRPMENTKAKEDSEVTDNMEAKEHHRARGRFRTRRKKSEDTSHPSSKRGSPYTEMAHGVVDKFLVDPH